MIFLKWLGLIIRILALILAVPVLFLMQLVTVTLFPSDNRNVFADVIPFIFHGLGD